MISGMDQARGIAYQCLYEVLEEQGYSNLVLKQNLASADLSAKEKAQVTAMVYGTITRVYTLDAVLSRYLSKDLSKLHGPVRTCLRMGAWQILFSYGVKNYAAVSETVELVKHVGPKGAESMVNAVLRKVAEEGEEFLSSIPKKKAGIRYSLKSEIAGCLLKWYGQDKGNALMEAFLTIPKVTVRTNLFRTSVKELEKELTKEGISFSESEVLPYGIEFSGNPTDISTLNSYREGLFSVQSLSAMLVGHIADPRPGFSVLDTCSAPGGKTTHMAEIMKDQGRIDALDANEVRLRMVDEAAARLGLSIIHTMPYDCTYLQEEKEKLLTEYDLVLCDVPCSGLGLLHRKPDIRLTMDYEKMQALIPVQEKILENSCERVKAGGCLVYSTCTIDPAENQLQIGHFLTLHPEFTCEDFSEMLPDNIKKNPRILKEAGEGMLTLLPDEGDFDGFFIAKLRRKE